MRRNAALRFAAVTATLWIAVPGVAGAQDITFNVPLSLTQVPADISKVAVWCRIESSAVTARSGRLEKQVEFPVSSGQLIMPATVVVPAIEVSDPVGKTATYTCSLSGYSTSLQRWDVFREDHPSPSFRLKPTPADLTGTFIF